MARLGKLWFAGALCYLIAFRRLFRAASRAASTVSAAFSFHPIQDVAVDIERYGDRECPGRSETTM
jgi:hypothetical protein